MGEYADLIINGDVCEQCMGEMGPGEGEPRTCWDCHKKQESAERRAGNRESSAEILTAHGVTFAIRNDGAHLIVQHPAVPKITYDFWPGTGKFHQRNTDDYSQRGVFNLLKRIGVAIKPEYKRK